MGRDMADDVCGDAFRALCVLQEGRHGLAEAVEHMLRAEAHLGLQTAPNQRYLIALRRLTAQKWLRSG
jgi:hypothetical protein